MTRPLIGSELNPVPVASTASAAQGMGEMGAHRYFWPEGSSDNFAQDLARRAIERAVISPEAMQDAYEAVQVQYRLDERTPAQLSEGGKAQLIFGANSSFRMSSLPSASTSEGAPMGLVQIGQHTLLGVSAVRSEKGTPQLRVRNLTVEQAIRTASYEVTRGLTIDPKIYGDLAEQTRYEADRYTTTIELEQSVHIGRKPRDQQGPEHKRPLMLAAIVPCDPESSRTHLAVDFEKVILPSGMESLMVTVLDRSANPAFIYPAAEVDQIQQ